MIQRVKLIGIMIVTLAMFGNVSALDVSRFAHFDEYAEHFGKNIASPDERQYRLTLFNAKKEEIERFNSEDHSYKKGINFFTDLTPEERQSYTGVRSNPPNVNIGLSIDNSDSNLIIEAKTSLGSHDPDSKDVLTLDYFEPGRVDWVAEGKVTPVKEQGECGSAWAFAAVGTIESYFLIEEDTCTDLSEQQLVDCTFLYGNFGCQGGQIVNTLNYIRQFGINTENDYPYTAQTNLCQFNNGEKLRIPDFYKVIGRSMSSYLTALTQGPVASAFAVKDSFYDYECGVYDAHAECGPGDRINHAVLAVGFDLDALRPYIKFKNQWGVNWGEDGYFRMSVENVDYTFGPCKLTGHDENSIVRK